MRALSTEAEGLCCQHAQQSPRGGQCWRSFSVGVWKDCHGYLTIIPVSCEYQCGGTRIPGTDESVLFLKQNVNYLEAPTVSSGEYSCEENPEHLRVLTLLGPNPKRSLVIAETVSPKSLRNFWMTNSNAVYFSFISPYFSAGWSEHLGVQCPTYSVCGSLLAGQHYAFCQCPWEAIRDKWSSTSSLTFLLSEKRWTAFTYQHGLDTLIWIQNWNIFNGKHK